MEKYQKAIGITDLPCPSDVNHCTIKRIANRPCPPNPIVTIICSGWVTRLAGRNGKTANKPEAKAIELLVFKIQGVGGTYLQRFDKGLP